MLSTSIYRCIPWSSPYLPTLFLFFAPSGCLFPARLSLSLSLSLSLFPRCFFVSTWKFSRRNWSGASELRVSNFDREFTSGTDPKICSPLARRRPEVVQLESCTVWSRNNPALERLHCYFGRQKFCRARSRLMRDASRSFAVSAPWPRLLSRVVLQGDDEIRPDFPYSFIVALDKMERFSDYHVINLLLVIRCLRRNGVSSLC